MSYQTALDLTPRLQVKPIGAADRRQTPLADTLLIDGRGTVMETQIRQLTAADAEAFKALRLEGLANHPCEFGTAYEEEIGLPIDEIERRLDEGQIFGAFLDDKLSAIAGFRRFDRVKKQHKAELFGVYVGRDARGRGLGEAVLREVIAVARLDVEQLLATVASLNLPAKTLYAKLGFEVFGREPRAQKVGNRYFDQEHLVLWL